MSTSVPEQTAPAVQDQQPAAPAPVSVQQPASGPWGPALAAAFPDEMTRAQVDTFMRSQTQPYITQLEQQVAASRDAMNLWNDFGTDAERTYVAITAELYGPEAAEKVKETIIAAQSPDTADTAPEQVASAVSELDPRLAAVVDYVEQQQTQAAYDQLMRQTIDANPDVNAQLLHPFIHAAGGDFTHAVTLYRNFMAQVPGAQQTAPQAPPVMGSADGISAPSNVPQEPRKQTLDEAINEFVRNQHAEAPPVL